jgi:hypothetical protein
MIPTSERKDSGVVGRRAIKVTAIKANASMIATTITMRNTHVRVEITSSIQDVSHLSSVVLLLVEACPL